MTPDELKQQHHQLVQRVAAGRLQMDMCSGLLAEVDMGAAIKEAALSISTNLRVDDCLPALSRAAVICTHRQNLFMALKVELIDLPESDLIAFKKLHGETLKNHFGI